MSDKRPGFAAIALAERLGGRLDGPEDLELRGVNTLEEASAGEITFIADASHARRWASSAATAAVVTQGIAPEGHDATRRALIHVPDAELAMVALLEAFNPPAPRPAPGVHPTACIDPGADLGPEVCIGPHVSVEAGVSVGAKVVLHAGVRLYPDVLIGDGCVLHANVVVRERCILGRGVILHQGVSIGADGFGYHPAPDGAGLQKLPHIGNVEIEDGVEIGANSCIDRGKFGTTRIGAGTKIDNLVHIGHNCRIGRSCAIAGLVGLGGSVTVGDGVQMGGAVSIRDHLTVGDGAQLGGRAGVARDVGPGEAVLGYPARPANDALRQFVALRKLPDWMKEIRARLQAVERRDG